MEDAILSARPRPCRSCRRWGGNAYPHKLRDRTILRQVLVRIELHGNPPLLAALRIRGPQNAAAAAHGHTFPQRDFRGHGKSQVDHRPFGQSRFSVKKYSTPAQILYEPWHTPPLELSRHGHMHRETLRSTTLQTIQFCLHRFILPEPEASRILQDVRCQLYLESNRRGSSKSVTGSRPVEIWFFLRCNILSSFHASCRHPEDVKKF
jgi:hypothetical protein